MMCAMILRLDSCRPIVWRTPTSLQIGVDPMLALLTDVSEGDAHVIDALATGVTRSGLEMLAERAGVTLERLDELLANVARALVAPESARSPVIARPPIVVIGRGVGAERVASVLLEAGYPVTFATTGEGLRARRPAAAVLVSGHVIDPLEHQRWLRRDVPHLAIVFGEAAATIGPLVTPGASACLGCVEQQRTSADPARPAVAAQLWGAVAAAESTSLATEAAVEALRMLRVSIPLVHSHGALTGPAHDVRSPTPTPTPAPGTATATAPATPTVTSRPLSVRLDSETGERNTRAWRPSERCGCHTLSAPLEPEPRRESGSVLAQPAPTLSAAPTTVRATFAPV